MADSAGERAELQVGAAPTIEKRIFVIRERQVMLVALDWFVRFDDYG